MSDVKIVNVDQSNISQYEPRCFLKQGNEGYLIKSEWLKERFKEGMKIKQMYLEKEGKSNAFIEYVPVIYLPLVSLLAARLPIPVKNPGPGGLWAAPKASFWR